MEPQNALEALLALGARLGREVPFDEPATVCSRLAGLGGARGLALFSVESNTGAATLLGSYGVPADYGRLWPYGEPLAVTRLSGDLREALLSPSPVLVPALVDDPRASLLEGVAVEGRFEAAMALALRIEQRVVGLLHAFYSTPAQLAEVPTLLFRTAPILAMALDRERLRNVVVQGLAEGTPPVGPRPGLISRTQIERQLRHVHAAADRYGQAYAVVVYAVDHAAAVAERYGPDLLGRAMAELGRCAAMESRAADQTGYLDRTSSLAVLPNTAERGAFSHAERTLTRFSRSAFRHHAARLQLSGSAGISCFPDSGAGNGEASIRSAREALDAALGVEDSRIIAIAAQGAALAHSSGEP